MNFFDFLSKTTLFRGILTSEIEKMDPCLTPVIKRYSKGESIFRFGDVITSLGIVLSGSVSIQRCDAWGNNSIIDKIEAGGIFGETYACLKSEQLNVDVTASEKTEVALFNINKVLYVCSNRCNFHSKLIENLMQNLARKNVALSNKMRYLTPKTIRARMISYLSSESFTQGKLTVEVPFNRQQLADYLSVERSALSNELSKMQDDGLIEYNKNRFKLNISHFEKE